MSEAPLYFAGGLLVEMRDARMWWERERERERESAREILCLCVCVYERESDRGE